jgi:periplasmic mercuric ion binding protein
MRAWRLERIVLGVASALLVALNAVAGQPRRVVLDVPDMTCPLCPITIEKTLERVPGVVAAKADFDTRRAEVTYDPDKVDPDALAHAVDAAGYHATVEQR